MRKRKRPGFALSLPCALATSILSFGASPAGPTPQVPEGGAAPGPFPNTSVTAVNVIARGSTTFNSSIDIPGLAGQGPVPWSVNRYNRGDIALRLSPGNPEAALSNLNQGFREFGDGAPSVPANQAWRPSPLFGVVIPTVRQNGPIDWNDGQGAFYPTIAVSEASSGPGYDMNSGAFANGNLDINTGRAGTHDSSPEANFPFSATWFPYDQGWIGGEVGAPDFEGKSSWTNPSAHTAGIVAGNVRRPDFPTGSQIFGGLAEIQLPGVNSLIGGMLFATSADGGSDVNIVGVAPMEDGRGWLLSIREDAATDAETLADAGQSEFQFVYVPYDSANLTGGYINGASGAKIQGRGNFSATRTGTGTYELSIPGENGTSGALILQAVGLEPGTSQPLATRAFLSYEYSQASGKFIVQSRVTATDTTADLRDGDFYFAWIDFESPLSPPAGVRLRAMPAVALTEQDIVIAREAALGINIHEPEVLVTTIDSSNAGGYTDPITGSIGSVSVIGHFINPITLQKTREPFVIVGNPNGNITRHDVVYNASSRQYNLVANGRTYGANAVGVPLIAIINPNSVAGENSPVVKAFAHDENSELTYDDVAIAASSNNGNFIVAAEHAFTGEGEGTVGILFDKTGTLLTPQLARLDTRQPTGDEDDPDIKYLESRDVFLYTSNTDLAGGLANRVTGAIIQTTPDGSGKLRVGTEQTLATGSLGGAEGHPASIENPWNGEIITVFDLGGNNVSRGGISYVTVGAAPDYLFSQARDVGQYLSGVTASGDPLKHNHPQIAVDPNSGIFLVGYAANGSGVGYPDGYVVSAFASDGSSIPSQFTTPFYISDTPGGVGNGAIAHNIKYSPVSDSFIVVYSTNPGVNYVTSVQVTSDHLPSVSQPTISIAQSSGQVTISWSEDASGYVLQSTETLTNPNWQNWTASLPITEGGMKKVSIAPSSPTRFFRLSRP